MPLTPAHLQYDDTEVDGERGADELAGVPLVHLIVAVVACLMYSNGGEGRIDS